MRDFRKLMEKISADLAKIGPASGSKGPAPATGQSSAKRRKYIEEHVDEDDQPLVQRGAKSALAKKRPRVPSPNLLAPSPPNLPAPSPPNLPAPSPPPESLLPWPSVEASAPREEEQTPRLICKPTGTLLDVKDPGLDIGRSMLTLRDKGKLANADFVELGKQALLCHITGSIINAELLDRIEECEKRMSLSDEVKKTLGARVEELETRGNQARADAERLAKELAEMKEAHTQEVQKLKMEAEKAMEKAAEQAVMDYKASDEFVDDTETEVMDGMKVSFDVALEAVARKYPGIYLGDIDMAAELGRASRQVVPAVLAPIDVEDEVASTQVPIAGEDNQGTTSASLPTPKP